MQCSQFSDGKERFDRRAFCKAGVATAVGVVEAGMLRSVLAHADLTKEQRDKMTPDEVIQQMKAGNERFRSGKPQHRDLMRDRLAVGATRFRLVRQVLAENLLLTALGAAAGLVVAVAGMSLAIRALPPIRAYPSPSLVPLSLNVGINWRVFLFLLVLSLVTMLLFSVSPAVAVSRSNLDSLLRATRSSARVRGRQALIVLQIALCTFLLAIASLLVRTFQHLQQVDPGFDRDHIATFTLNLNAYTGKTTVFLKTFTERVRAIPGVISVGVSSLGVMRGVGTATTVAPAGQRLTQTEFLNTSLLDVSPEYFDTMGMHILSGRGLIPSDAPEPKQAGPERVVVNQAFVLRFFPNTQALGKLFGYGPPGDVAGEKDEIVGVVSDSKYRSLRAPVVPVFYECETDFDQFVLNVRTRTRPAAIIEPVRKTLASLDPGLPFLEVHTMAEEADISMASERITAALASLFGGIAALLAGVGIYGLLAYVVRQRRREIGIRMALGALPADIGKLIAGQTLAMTAAGIILGLGRSGRGTWNSLAAVRHFAAGSEIARCRNDVRPGCGRTSHRIPRYSRHTRGSDGAIEA